MQYANHEDLQEGCNEAKGSGGEVEYIWEEWS